MGPQRLWWQPQRRDGCSAESAGFWLVPWLLAAGYGAASLFSVFLPEKPATPPAARHSFAGLKLFGSKSFRLAVGGTALIQGAHAAYYGFAALFWRSQGLSDTVIGLLIAEGIVAEILLFARGRRLVERLGPAGFRRVRGISLDFALDGDGGCAAFAGACNLTQPSSPRRHLRHAAFVGDAGADPRYSPRTRRHRPSLTRRPWLWCAHGVDDAVVRLDVCPLRRLGLPAMAVSGGAGWFLVAPLARETAAEAVGRARRHSHLRQRLREVGADQVIGVLDTDAQPDQTVGDADALTDSSGTPEWVVDAGWLARSSVPPRLTASLKIRNAFSDTECRQLAAANFEP